MKDTTNEDEKQFSLPETHIERMDRMQFEADQEKELAKISADRDKYVAKQRVREDRTEMWIWVAGFAAVAAVVIAIIYAAAIHEGPPKTPEDYKNTETYRESQCYENGGGWVPGDQLYGTPDRGICVFPGKAVAVPTS